MTGLDWRTWDLANQLLAHGLKVRYLRRGNTCFELEEDWVKRH